MAYLKHIVDGRVVCLYDLTENTSIGRNETSDICLDDATVSADHAVVFFKEDRWQVRDLESTNGLLVQGAKKMHEELEHGSTFNIGTHQFEFLAVMNKELDRTLKIKKSWIPGVFYTQ